MKHLDDNTSYSNLPPERHPCMTEVILCCRRTRRPCSLIVVCFPSPPPPGVLRPSSVKWLDLSRPWHDPSLLSIPESGPVTIISTHLEDLVVLLATLAEAARGLILTSISGRCGNLILVPIMFVIFPLVLVLYWNILVRLILLTPHRLVLH